MPAKLRSAPRNWAPRRACRLVFAVAKLARLSVRTAIVIGMSRISPSRSKAIGAPTGASTVPLRMWIAILPLVFGSRRRHIPFRIPAEKRDCSIIVRIVAPRNARFKLNSSAVSIASSVIPSCVSNSPTCKFSDVTLMSNSGTPPLRSIAMFPSTGVPATIACKGAFSTRPFLISDANETSSIWLDRIEIRSIDTAMSESERFKFDGRIGMSMLNGCSDFGFTLAGPSGNRPVSSTESIASNASSRTVTDLPSLVTLPTCPAK